MGKRIFRNLTLQAVICFFLCVIPFQARAELDISEIREAASQGDADAQYLLGMSYAEGQDISKDEINAYAWSSLAAMQGVEAAAKHRDNIAGNFSIKQLHEAQALAEEYQAKIDKQMKRPPSLRFRTSSVSSVATNAELRSWLQNVKPAAGGE
ncbi:MAG: hypothetical protein KKD63_04775 [Proteobacteria bacterium]|nr:sel1 repeat family protein [Desulfobulbaceae bacterium]MBU4152175.1 hypothetical protein [Pseudomonadota bacterium]